VLCVWRFPPPRYNQSKHFEVALSSR
jgi:hypothetical protein